MMLRGLVLLLALLIPQQQSGFLSCTCVSSGQTGPQWLSELANQSGAVLVWNTNVDQSGPVLLIVCKGPEGMSKVHGYAQLDIDLTTAQLRVVNVQPPPVGFHC